MVKARGAGWRRGATAAFPCVEAEVVMVTSGRNKRRLRAESLGQPEPEHAAVKVEGALQVGHLEMHMPDPCAGTDRIFMC